MPQKLIRYRGDGETGLSLKIKKYNYKAVYQPRALVYHLVSKKRLNVEYLEKRNFNQGISNSYTEIRRKYIPDEYPSVPNKVNKHTIVSKIRNFFFRVISSVFESIFSLFKRKTLMNDEYNELRKRMELAYKEGFEYHQNEIKNDPELLK